MGDRYGRKSSRPYTNTSYNEEGRASPADNDTLHFAELNDGYQNNYRSDAGWADEDNARPVEFTTTDDTGAEINNDPNDARPGKTIQAQKESKADTPRVATYEGRKVWADVLMVIPGKIKHLLRIILDPKRSVFHYLLFLTVIIMLIVMVTFFGDLEHHLLEHRKKMNQIDKILKDIWTNRT